MIILSQRKKNGELNNRSKEIVQNVVQGDKTIGSVKDLLRNRVWDGKAYHLYN